MSEYRVLSWYDKAKQCVCYRAEKHKTFFGIPYWSNLNNNEYFGYALKHIGQAYHLIYDDYYAEQHQLGKGVNLEYEGDGSNIGDVNGKYGVNE